LLCSKDFAYGSSSTISGSGPALPVNPNFQTSPQPQSSPTAHVLAELQLYGWRPFQDEPDPRPLPEAPAIGGAVADIFDALDDLLWAAVNLFHRAAGRVERELDDNEVALKRSQKEQDGSEIRSVELERLVAEGLTLIERRDVMELFRDHAADLYERHTSSPWRSRTGSKVNHRALTAAVIDSRAACIFGRQAASTSQSCPPVPFAPQSASRGARILWPIASSARSLSRSIPAAAR
jgi:hypothetical protein